ncbi:carboxypeptidase-like regulatory domain-containing protein, partial [Enterobacter roggenkampii]
MTSFIGAAAAQSTTGSLFGNAPAGTTIVVQSDTGLTRSATVDSSGRYNLGSLPVGKYTITQQRDGQTIERRENVLLRVGGGTEVSFGGGAAGATTLGTVNVVAANVPKIDVSNT